MIEVTQKVLDQMQIIASQLTGSEYGNGTQAIQHLVRWVGAEKFGIDTTRSNVNFQFMFPKGNRGINYVRIELNQDDLYDVYFASVKGNEATYLEEITDLYNDSLAEVFTHTTGHRLS